MSLLLLFGGTGTAATKPPTNNMMADPGVTNAPARPLGFDPPNILATTLQTVQPTLMGQTFLT